MNAASSKAYYCAGLIASANLLCIGIIWFTLSLLSGFYFNPLHIFLLLHLISTGFGLVGYQVCPELWRLRGVRIRTSGARTDCTYVGTEYWQPFYLLDDGKAHWLLLEECELFWKERSRVELAYNYKSYSLINVMQFARTRTSSVRIQGRIRRIHEWPMATQHNLIENYWLANRYFEWWNRQNDRVSCKLIYYNFVFGGSNSRAHSNIS
jgi:hypothetical protein